MERIENLILGFFQSGRSIEEVSSILNESKIKFRKEPCQTNKNIDCLYLESGSKLMFCREVEEFMHPDYTGFFGFSLSLETKKQTSANQALQATSASARRLS